MTNKDKKIIEDSEREGIPIFVLTAKDVHSIQAIRAYLTECAVNCEDHHILGITERYTEFEMWQANNPDRVKIPD